MPLRSRVPAGARRVADVWRVRLRSVRPDDGSAVDPWLPEALAAASGVAVQHAPSTLRAYLAGLPRGREALLIGDTAGAPLGVLVVAVLTGRPPLLELLAIAAERRGVGLGSEAVYALEERLGQPFFAGVPRANGRAIYFWLRAGYHPLYPHSLLGLAPGRNWLLRGDRSFVPAATGADPPA